MIKQDTIKDITDKTLVLSKPANITDSINNSMPDDILTYFKPILENNKTPHDLQISTMTITCKLDSQLNTVNIGKYIKLNSNITTVQFDNDTKNIRYYDSSFRPKIKKARKAVKKKVKKMVYNQVTVKVMTKYKDKPVNVKLFKNGSIQMTGCVSVLNGIQVIRLICDLLLQNRSVIINNNITDIEFVTNKENINILKVKDFKVGMINSNFNIGYMIDRSKLYKVMIQNNIECTYEPCVHACVNIRYIYKSKSGLLPNIKKKQYISIFVFESGATIITGALHNDHLTEAHQFITKKLCENYNKIVKLDIDTFIESKEIQDMIEACNLEKEKEEENKEKNNKKSKKNKKK